MDNESEFPGQVPSDSAPDPVHGEIAQEPFRPLPRPRVPAWDYGDLLVILCCALPSYLLASVLSWTLLLITGIRDKNVAALPTEFLAYLIWFFFLALMLRMKYNLGFWSALSWKFHTEDVLPAVLGGFVLALAVGFTGYMLKTPPVDNGPIQQLMKNPLTRVMLAVSATTVGPICEELLFRGFVLPLLARSAGATAGITLSALPFALLHGPQYHWTWQLVLLIFCVGCAFGWARVKTGSTATSALMHASYNSVFFLTFLFQKGLEP